MKPDFSSKTKNLLARQAGTMCSNPDCGIQTDGPNVDPKKITTIGEAAHIYGARPGSSRYKTNMNDSSRAAITNGIWLCGNCHTKIDKDAELYPAALLFRWVEQHRTYLASQLGNKNDQMRYEINEAKYEAFNAYPLIIRRIVRDKPDGWEWMLSAQLLRHLNQPIFERFTDLEQQLIFRSGVTVDEDNLANWVHEQLSTMERIVPAIMNCLERLQKGWGAKGEEGNANTIHSACLLVAENLSEVVRHEESLRFTLLPEIAERLQKLLQNQAKNAVIELRTLPEKFENFVQQALEAQANNEPSATVELPIVFELSESWADEVIDEMKLIYRTQL